MSFNSLETSQFGSLPVECFQFIYGDAVVASYTDSDVNIMLDEVDYVPFFIERGHIITTQDSHKTVLSITLERNTPLFDIFKVWMDDKLYINVYRTHQDDLDNKIILFKGRVLTLAVSGNTIKLDCESSFSAMSRNGLSRRHSIGCPYTLYTENSCKVDITTYREEWVVKEINGNAITLTGTNDRATAYFAGGIFFTSVTAPIMSRMISVHTWVSATEAIVTVSSIPSQLSIDDTVYIAPGCDKTQIICLNRFANSANFGGIPFLPTRNPYTNPPPILLT